ncbi:MAG: FecR domain-containing protein [Bacteroidota bacterium]|nr:FecR domain-containing protein [Bacteroidota bacterium]
MDQKSIDKVLSKTASPEEARKVAVWFATDEGQEYLSRRFDRESYFLDEQTVEEWADTEIPSDRMKIRLLTRLRIHVRTFRFRLAAAVLIPFVVLVGAFLFVANRSGVFTGTELAEVKAPYGEQMQVILQDGTIVQLNSGSSLQYPKTFGLFNRKVRLSGEGYFSVAKQADRPFIVNLNHIDVKVTGTKFNAKAYPDDNLISVSLEEGSVKIIDKKSHVYALKVGQNADYNKKSGVCTISNVDDMTQHTSWRTKSLNFYRTPLKEILKTLERQYEVQFDIGDSSLLNYRFSISTSKVNANEILKDLEKVSKITFRLTDNNRYEVSSIK